LESDVSGRRPVTLVVLPENHFSKGTTMPAPNLKRIIYVAEHHKEELNAALRHAKAGAYGAIGAELARDIYTLVKNYLTGKSVPHADKHMDPNDVPDGHHYWHH
jgi:hypothetical protein